MSKKVLVISEDKRIFDFIRSSLGSSVLIENPGIDEINQKDKPYEFIFLGCDYRCSFIFCMRKFLFLKMNKKIPFLVIRPILLERGYESYGGFLSSFFETYTLSSFQEEIPRKIKNSEHYGCSPGWMIHPSNLLFKISKVQREIVENPWKRFNLFSFSENVSLSPSWLSLKFNEISGISFERFSIRIRFCYSLWELLSTEKQIKLIAYERGYKDPLSFTKRFHSLFGVAPSFVRKEFNTLSSR
ncbi:MAG: AraC family transcriptional regulator [Acidobacteriota bacterium]